ncbi:Superfamily I DNA or RNA helicase [Paracidovorax valerianellae]|uniref:Superfamily I DNA or RNA helicase n=2 Tax=Paracidovorax valerianellae TaxID=187868 RepID=A0A1G6L4J1_9BURK|nr:Superfamily I DNA or RNA helicase [Paracidovorax valerianellae]
MMELSAEQLAIIDAPLEPMSVVACAGSGKTRTAVRRLAEIRKRLGDHRGRVALLSFSNVAVDTFRQSYQSLVQALSPGIGRDRVEIDTLDGFITSNVLRPHGHRTMGCDRTPFLIAGTEPFLRNKDLRFWVQSATEDFPVQPVDMRKVVVNLQAGAALFHYQQHNALLPINNGPAVAARLAEVGAYTHNLGRYWCYRALLGQPGVLRALVRRYPHILIDEAQDIGTLHQAILEQLIKAGAQISLIGDPNQGIYEFAGANGAFLTQYGQRPGVNGYGLTRNYRSVPEILALANKLSIRTDIAERGAPDTLHGAYFIAYKNAEREQLITAFHAAVVSAGLKTESAAVLCRGRDLADKLAGNDAPAGQGIVKVFAQATILRDRRQDYLGAFKLVAAGIVGLLADPPQGLIARITQPARYREMKPLRRLIWRFTRNPDTGLPAAGLTADTQWHPLLLVRTKALLAVLDQEFGLKVADNLGNKLAKKALPSAPLMTGGDLAAEKDARIRVDTVHQAKGESLDAVLYLATKEHVSALLAGVCSELGRIGYVAATRARNLLWLGVPSNALAELRPALLARGFQEVGVAVAVAEPA